MLEKITRYLQKNNHNGSDLCKYIENTSHDRRHKAHWQVASSNLDSDGKVMTRSGIIKYMGTRYYFYCIAPWAMLPEGRIVVEKLER